MDQIINIAKVIAPILAAVALGMLARRRSVMSEQDVRGLQQFVMKFGLPCVIFNSCLTADIGGESLTSMALVVPPVLLGTLWAFRVGRKRFPFHNLPQIFTAKETGMLGIPRFMILFGADQAYRVGVLDLAQSFVAIPTIAILTAAAGEDLAPAAVAKKVFSSPLMILSILGLGLNISGAADWLAQMGILEVLTECTGFLGQPISALMIFAVGYNFSLDRQHRAAIFRVSALHFVYFTLFGLLIQGVLFLIPGVDALTRWALLLYTMLPASYLAPTLGKDQEDYTVASDICSMLTVPTLIVFCIMAVILA